LATAGIWGEAEIPPTVTRRQRESCELRVLKKLRRAPRVWESFFRELVPADSGVWIDSIAVDIGSSPDWELKGVSVSVPAQPLGSPPPDFDVNKLLAWLSLAQAVATEAPATEFTLRWLRTTSLIARWEAVTENQAAATKLHEKLSAILKASGSSAKSAVFEGASWWRVDVEGEDFAVPAPATSRPSEGSHKISVKVTAEGAVIADASETVESLDGARKLVVAVGDKLEKAFDKAIRDGVTPYPVTVSVEVGAGSPVGWLEAVLFDLKDSAEVVEVCQDLFFQSTADVILTIEGSVRRCPVRPFKTVGFVGSSGAAEKHVLAGLEVPGDPAAREIRNVILGRASAVTRTSTWLSLDRGSESRPTLPVVDGPSRRTTSEVGAALRELQRRADSTKLREWRQALPLDVIEEVHGSEIVVPARSAFAGRRAWVVTREGSVYVGTVEVAGLPSIEDPKSVPCKIIERSPAAGAPAFAKGQLVVFQPE
jgi:hypothetical protein